MKSNKRYFLYLGIVLIMLSAVVPEPSMRLFIGAGVGVIFATAVAIYFEIRNLCLEEMDDE